jgi:transcriptional regulator with XRE-family HTH domain
MPARKKAARRKGTRRKPSARAGKAAGRASSSSRAGRPGRPRSGSRAGRPARGGARAGAASLADRLALLVEHAAAGALRFAVDAGGREFGTWLPEASEMRREAGAYLRELRQLAGLTVDELADAIELGDRSLIEAVEEGTATLSFELVLRIAAILARHDPVPFVARLIRTYNPVLWQLLDDWGVGRLPLQLERERQFVNVLRGHDEARALPDRDFEAVLAFTRAAFELALHFAARAPEPAEPEAAALAGG